MEKTTPECVADRQERAEAAAEYPHVHYNAVKLTFKNIYTSNKMETLCSCCKKHQQLCSWFSDHWRPASAVTLLGGPGHCVPAWVSVRGTKRQQVLDPVDQKLSSLWNSLKGKPKQIQPEKELA